MWWTLDIFVWRFSDCYFCFVIRREKIESDSFFCVFLIAFFYLVIVFYWRVSVSVIGVRDKVFKGL